MGVSAALQLCHRAGLRAPSTTGTTRPHPRVQTGTEEAHGGLQEIGLPHTRLSTSARGDAVTAVFLEVAMKMIRANKRLKAAGALVRPQAGVYAHVILQVVVVSERCSTLRTQVRLLSGVLPHVDFELVLPGKAHFADGAFIRFFSCVRSDMAG